MASSYGGGAAAPTTNLGTEPGKKRRRRRNRQLTGTRDVPRYGRNERVKGGTDQRSRERLKRTGPIKGVDVSDGIQGGEARKIKRVDRNRPDHTPNHSPKRRGAPRRSQIDPFQQEVDALTQLQFGAQERELAGRQQQEQQFGVNQQAWYAKHVQDMLLAQTRQQAFQQGIQAAAYQQANTAAATDTSQNQQLLQQQQADAAQRGTSVSPELQQTLQQGVAARQAMGTAGGNLLAQQGQAQGAFMANQVVQGGQQAIQAQQDNQAKQRRLAELAQELASDKGAFQVKARSDIQEREHKERLENAAFGLDVEEERAQQRDRRIDNRRQARNDRFSRRDRRADNRRADRAEQRQQRNTDDLIRDRREDNARQRQADLADDGKRNGSNFTPTQVRSGRRTLRNLVGRVKNNVDPPASVDPLLARAAVQIADNGGVTPELARKIKRQYGFTPKIKRTTVRRPRNAPAPGGDRPT